MPEEPSPGTPTTTGGVALALASALPLLRFAVRALRITASTIAVVALLRQEWVAGAAFGVAWLLLLQAPRLFPLLQHSEAE